MTISSIERIEKTINYVKSKPVKLVRFQRAKKRIISDLQKVLNEKGKVAVAGVTLEFCIFTDNKFKNGFKYEDRLKIIEAL